MATDTVSIARFVHLPNVDAAQFLISEIMTILRQELESVKVVLVGSKPTEAVRALDGENVEVDRLRHRGFAQRFFSRAAMHNSVLSVLAAGEAEFVKSKAGPT